jgi:sugar lactone lactonase YvrE
VAHRSSIPLALALLAAGCSAGAPTPAAPGGAATRAVRPQKAAAEYVYVMDRAKNAVDVYSPTSAAPVRTIATGISLPSAMAFDAKNDLWVANQSAATVTEYAAGTATLAFTVASPAGSSPLAIAFDKSGSLYVADTSPAGGSIEVYQPGSTTPARTITAGIKYPAGLTFDADGNLWVANSSGSVTAYAPGSTEVLYTISKGIANPTAVAIGTLPSPANAASASRASIVVANDGSPVPSLTEYAYATRKLKLAMKAAWTGTYGALAFAPGSGPRHLFAANKLQSGAGSVAVYGTGRKPVATITKGVRGPSGFAFDGAGNLYVANATGASVTEYAHGTYVLLRTISSGLTLPAGVAVAPQ